MFVFGFKVNFEGNVLEKIYNFEKHVIIFKQN